MAANMATFPFFLLTFFFLYWSMAIGTLVGRVKFWQYNGTNRNEMFVWAKLCSDFLGVKYLKTGSGSLYKKERCVYLSNHRSWADFFVDVYLTEGIAQAMARTMVGIAFPMFIGAATILRGILLFKRGSIANKDKFNTWLDDKLNSSPCSSLLVFPEGHRSTKSTSLPLKRGMLYYAHSRGLPVQVIMTRGKELVLSEKHHHAGYGTQLITGFSELVLSKDKEFEQFWTEVQAMWDRMWAEVYSVDPSTAVPYTQDVPGSVYPLSMSVLYTVFTVSTVIFLLSTLWIMARIFGFMISPLPAMLQMVVWGAVPVTLAVSFRASIIDNAKTSSSAVIKTAKKAQ